MFAHLKLGRHAPSAAQKALAPKLTKYMRAPLPPPPLSCNNSDGALIAMWGNDRYGDCTFAALANFRAICAAKEKLPFPTVEGDVVKAYLAFTHGRDEGAVEHDVLNAASKGLALGGSEPWRLAAWVSVDINDRETCRRLVADLWGLYLGCAMPLAAQSQRLWDCDPRNLSGDAAPGSWGGHALWWADYEETGDSGLVTWGMVQKATPAWLSTYCDEAYALLDEDRAKMLGVDWDALVYDLQAAGGMWLAGEKGARIDPTPPDGRGWDDPDDQGSPAA